MGKQVYIAEKPSVARAFAQALGVTGQGKDGYLATGDIIVTWCVGHLVTMCYPEAYDASLKKWSMQTLPFLPDTFRYEVIPAVKRQFQIVSGLLNREDVDTIYVCTDAGREGEYIYRLVETQAKVSGKERKRVWIDAQTEEEILRGIREAKDLSAYDNLGAAAYLRAKEDYLMGINFSRALTLKYGNPIKNYLKIEKCVIATGRVMTCVLGMVVDREREIRDFVKTPYYGVDGGFAINPTQSVNASWRVNDHSRYQSSPLLYNEKGFKEKSSAEELIRLTGSLPKTAVVEKNEKKKETKNPPLLYNLAELQNDCSRYFKISPDQTLQIAQELYEKKLTTYPRTDARVMSSAVAKEIEKNITGLTGYAPCAIFAKSILQHGSHKTIAKTRYVNDKAVTDHYAIIPTGQGLGALKGLSATAREVYDKIVRRFLAVFYPPAIFDKCALTIAVPSEDERYTEHFNATIRLLKSKGFLHVLGEREERDAAGAQENPPDAASPEEETSSSAPPKDAAALMEAAQKLRKGSKIELTTLTIRESETTPPKRYNSGTLILAMENAGQLIEDEELRAQIKGSGIGTSATRAEILKKLVANRYLSLNAKTQIVTPTQLGEMIYETTLLAMKPMLSPTLTASWEKGLSGVARGEIPEAEYTQKLNDFVRRRVEEVRARDHTALLMRRFDVIALAYRKKQGSREKPQARGVRKPKDK